MKQRKGSASARETSALPALANTGSLEAMEARLVGAIPTGDEWQYEPKWDGFRCLLQRDGDHVEMTSKSGQPLARYFPEITAAALACRAKKFHLDCELVIARDGALSFNDLLQRIHPAESRVRKLAASTPATAVVFDLLADERGASWLEKPLRERRAGLEKFFDQYLSANESFRLSPTTLDAAQAQRWLAATGANCDGVMAKRRDLPYQAGTREGMQKIKKIRTADCVVGGFRYGSKTREIGSLLLGLYNDEGLLDHVGFCSGIKAGERAALTKKVEANIKPPGFTGKAPGGPSRWNNGRESEWKPLRTEWVVEVSYDHFTGGRFRHGTRLLRWRPDKKTSACLLAQVEREATVSVPAIFNAAS